MNFKPRNFVANKSKLRLEDTHRDHPNLRGSRGASLPGRGWCSALSSEPQTHLTMPTSSVRTILKSFIVEPISVLVLMYNLLGIAKCGRCKGVLGVFMYERESGNRGNPFVVKNAGSGGPRLPNAVERIE